jgi:CBS domain-containing protein
MAKVKDIMKSCVITIDPDETITYASRVMTNNRIGALVVMDGGKPIDMVTVADVTTVIAKGLDPNKVTVADVKRNHVKDKKTFVTVSPQDDIMKLVKLMVKNGVKRVPVLDRGKLVGIVADKEVLLVSPETMEIMSERLRQKIGCVPRMSAKISGICEDCGQISDGLQTLNGRWMCPECRADE